MIIFTRVHVLENVIFIQLVGFKGGNMTIGGFHIDMIGFGIHPKRSTTVLFCCKDDSNSTLSEVFPHMYPFVLLKVGISFDLSKFHR